MLDKHTVEWTKGRKVWSYLHLPPARPRDPSSSQLGGWGRAACPLPPHARSTAAPWAGMRQVQKVWKPKQAPGETFSLAGANFTWCPSPWRTTLSTSSSNSSKQSSKHWLWAIKPLLPEATRPPALQVKEVKALSPGRHLELIPQLALESCLVGLSNAHKSSGLSWRLRRRGCQRSMKGGRSAVAQLARWICVCVGGRFTTSYSFYCWICASAWKFVPALLYKQEHRKLG